MIRVSVVMPVYNGEKYLKQSIESVIQQSYKDWELIIVNDVQQIDQEILCKAMWRLIAV